MFRSLSPTLTVGFALSVGLALAPPPVPAQEAPGPCSHENSHQFDFWIGEWDVFVGEKLAGENSIQPILGGCVLQETWAGKGGSAGSSFNFFNPQTEKWQQFWVWRNGTTLELEGSYEDGKMTLGGVATGQDGEDVHQRITWYDNEDGTVRQHWESRTGDAEWQTAFDGLYRKKE